MTYNELKDAVSQLGFESGVGDEEAFIGAAGRALSILFIDRPSIVPMELFVTPPRVMELYPVIRHRGGESISFRLTGAAISFTTAGIGEYTLRRGDSLTTVTFGPSEVIRLFIDGEVELTFGGKYDYTVTGLCSFASTTGPSIEDIPVYSRTLRHAPDRDRGDFSSFFSRPTDENGNIVAEARLEGGMIELPFDFEGELYYSYCRTPRKILGQSDEIIDVPRGLEPLLALLTASFLWLDDNSGMAQYYMALYRDVLSGIVRYSKSNVSTDYETNGWA